MTIKQLQVEDDALILVQIEADLPNIAKRIAKMLVREKMATKAMVIPRVTAYEWVGKLLMSRRLYRVEIITRSVFMESVTERLQELAPEASIRKIILAGQ